MSRYPAARRKSKQDKHLNALKYQRSALQTRVKGIQLKLNEPRLKLYADAKAIQFTNWWYAGIKTKEKRIDAKGRAQAAEAAEAEAKAAEAKKEHEELARIPQPQARTRSTPRRRRDHTTRRDYRGIRERKQV